jgi:hypothetical protein
MHRSTGQILRFVGLLIEMLGILGLAFWTRTDPAGTPLPGSFPPRLAWIVVGLGFVIWLAGNTLIYWPRVEHKRKSSKSRIDDLQL